MMDNPDEDANITAITNEIIARYRAYFSLLRNYRQGNHEKIMQQLEKMKELEKRLREAAGQEAASKLFHACYQTVLMENSWAILHCGMHWASWG